MKNKLIIFIIFILSYNSLLAYNSTIEDKNIISKVSNKIIPIIEKYPSKILILNNRILELKEEYKNNEKIYYIFSELEKLIATKTATNNEKYLVSKVIDWDTVKLENDNWDNLTIRLIWIDSPESYKTRYWYIECYWEEAKIYLKNLIEWRIINLEYDESQWKTDKYWRTLGYINYSSENINWKMIREWYAWEYTYNKKYNYSDIFKLNQEDAQLNNKWLWLDSTCNWERKEVIIQEIYQIETNYDYKCLGKKYCKEMNSCEEAKFYLNSCNINTLDGDNDWIPCESICD